MYLKPVTYYWEDWKEYNHVWLYTKRGDLVKLIHQDEVVKFYAEFWKWVEIEQGIIDHLLTDADRAKIQAFEKEQPLF